MAFADFAVGASQGLQQLLYQRELERMGVSPAQILQRQQARADQELQLRQQVAQQNQQRQSMLDQEAAQQKAATEANTLGDQLPPGLIMSPTDPAAAMMQKGGRGGLLTKNVTLPSTQMTGTDLGRLTTRSVPSDNQVQSLTKVASQKQIDTNTDNARQQMETLARIQDLQQRAQDRSASEADRQLAQQQLNEYRTVSLDLQRQGLALRQGEHKKQWIMRNGQPVYTESILPGDSPYSASTGELKKQWVMRGGKLVYDVPQTGDAPRPGATVENRLSSAQAVNDTGTDIIAKLSDPKYAALVGSALGRYSSLQDFIGNPPPEFSDLAGNIESFALANMGVHGMRSVEGANQIKGLLNAKHTPQSLIAAIRGLSNFSQHYMQNEGRSPGSSTTPPPQTNTQSGGGFQVIGVR